MLPNIMDETVIFSNAPSQSTASINRLKKQKSGQSQPQKQQSSGWSLAGSLQRSNASLASAPDGLKVTRTQTSITDSRKMSEDSLLNIQRAPVQRDSVTAETSQKYEQRRQQVEPVIPEMTESRTGESDQISTTLPRQQQIRSQKKSGKLFKSLRKAWKSLRSSGSNTVKPLPQDPVEKHLVHDSDGALALEFQFRQSSSVFRIDPRSQMHWSDLTILAPLSFMPFTTDIDIKKPMANVFIGFVNSSVSQYLISKHRLVPEQRVYVQVFSRYLHFIKALAVMSLFQSQFTLEFVPKIMGFGLPLSGTKFIDFLYQPSMDSQNLKWSISTPVYPLSLRELVSRVWKNMRERETIPNIITNTFRLLKQLITAVSELHREGVYHNSLTPDNIRLHMDGKNSNWNICIYNFQHVYIQGTSEDDLLKEQLDFSGIDELYVAPELSLVASEATVPYSPSSKSDIYSFGMLAYYIIERADPFSELSYDNAIMFLKMGGARPEWKSSHLMLGQVMGDDRYPQLIETIEACWNEDADARPTVEYVKIAIESCCVVSSGESAEFVASQGVDGQLSLKPQLIKRLR